MSKLRVILIAVLSLLSYWDGVGCANENAQVRDVDILFYGKIVDQFYAPVADANVAIEVLHSPGTGSTGIKNVVIKTDENGLFTLKDKGISIHIENVEKSGCRFLAHKNADRDFEYSHEYTKAVFIPDKRSPLIFHVRRLEGEPAYLIYRPSVEMQFSPDQTHEYNLDLLGAWIDDRGVLHRASGGGHTDLNITCALSHERDAYNLTFISTDTNSGVLVSEKTLEQAPPDGYEPEAGLQVSIPEKYEQSRIQLYVKARGGQAYSRLDLELTVRPSNLLIAARFWTNPAASRNLKYDPQFQKYEKKRRYDERERCYQEQLSAMRRRERLKYEPRIEFVRSRKNTRSRDIQNPKAKPPRYYNEYYYSYHK